MYASIIVDIANENVDRLFTYRLDINADIGQRVLVPFGRGNKLTEGFILDITDKKPQGEYEIKSVARTLEDYCALDKEQIELARWICKAYHCTMAQALRLMIPAQLRGMRISEKKIRCVKIKDGADTIGYLEALKTKNGKIRSTAVFDTVTILMQTNGCMPVSMLYELVPSCNSAVVKKLIDIGMLTEEFITVYRKPQTLSYGKSERPVLTDEQENALASIVEGFKCGGTYLLHGVTGSGKTEVYMSAIEKAVSVGKGAIVLVPEISLTPQTVMRFTERFGDRVAVLHSRLSAGERFDEWRRIRNNSVDVVVGARSAIFAPIHDLGIVIIDEEHENAYSSEQIPRYNALEVAQKRCKISGGVLVLGSATPSVTTYFRAKLGKYKLLELKNRVNSMPLPEIEVVDMRTEFLSGNNGIFSERLKERLSECKDKGEQAILFLNRRGYSSFISCRACGYVFECASCDVSMTYHKLENKMKCHYCGVEEPVPTVCPKCNKAYIKYSGIGTEQIEEELKSLFPDMTSIRMDADTTQGKDAHTRLLSEFASGKAQVLIGTQMIAKGLDFPNVTLVGVVSVDAMLAMPDFRNTERTFQLLTQVSGRAGRADKKGVVVLQTSNPTHPVIEFAKAHDYESFYNYAISSRLENLYPPYSVFVRILFTGDDDSKVREDSVKFINELYTRMVELLKSENAELSQILFIYAMPAPIKRIQNKQRHHILMKLMRTKQTAKLINCIYEYAKSAENKSFSSVEVNPNDML